MQKWLCFPLFISSLTLANAQDTLRLNLQQADSVFLANNYYLLAASMNIQAQKAEIIQAKVYPNPIFTAEINTYDPDNNQAFHIGQTGQKTFQLEQLIVLGGKRSKEIELAKLNAQIAELEFQKLVLELKFKLRSNLYTIGQQQFLLTKYTKQLAFLDTLIQSHEAQVIKGNIPIKELVRLKAAYMELNNERSELYHAFSVVQTELQTLLQTEAIILPEIQEKDLSTYFHPISLQELQDAARENLPEMQILQQNKTLAEQYVKYQKSLAVPDINVFVNYDQRGGAFNNQLNTGLAIPLPIWNRNQGAIKSQQFKLQQVEYEIKAREYELQSQLANSYAYFKHTLNEYARSQELYNEDFEKTMEGMNQNFQRRNISLVEYIDFTEAYYDVLAELMRVKTQVVMSAEQLNLLTGKAIF